MRIRTFVSLLLLLSITAGVVFVLRPNETILKLPMEAWGRLVPVWGVILGAFAAGMLIALVLQVSGVGRNAFRRARSLLSARRREALTKLIEKARRAEREGRDEEAISCLREACGTGGGSFEASMRLGDLLRRIGRPHEAVTAYGEARRIDPLSDEPGHALALEWLELGELDRARRELVATIEKNPKRAVSQLRQLRELEILAGDWVAAGAAAKRLEAIVGRRAPAGEHDRIQALGIRTELARGQAEAGETRAATADLRRLIKEAPHYVPARILLAQITSEAGETVNEREVLVEGFRLRGDVALLDTLAEGDLARSRPEEAISTLRGIVAARHHERAARYALGKLYLRLEMLDEAAEQFQLLHEEHEDCALVSICLARVEEKRADTTRAAELYRSVLDAPSCGVREARCGSCQSTQPAWQHRCPVCGVFGSLHVGPDMPAS